MIKKPLLTSRMSRAKIMGVASEKRPSSNPVLLIVHDREVVEGYISPDALLAPPLSRLETGSGCLGSHLAKLRHTFQKSHNAQYFFGEFKNSEFSIM